MRDLENRAGNIASMLVDLVRQGEGARSLVRQAMLADGRNSTRHLESVEGIALELPPGPGRKGTD